MKYILILLLGNFIASVSQVMLKKAADRSWPSPLREYLNPLVVGAYVLFGLSTVLNERLVLMCFMLLQIVAALLIIGGSKKHVEKVYNREQ